MNVGIKIVSLFSLPVIVVLYVGLLFSAFIAVISGVLRASGIESIPMSILPGVTMPVWLSMPMAVIVAGLLLWFTNRLYKILKQLLFNIRN
ncbi:hypothetical protein JF544_01280 [Halobacillus kuroshimensis]|uniref:Uncharacterized protein n=1 Tax=Halobacillus kuroshimensis TaxID=302481 RepID=A0ABS3DR86_9BACI|nr:MULTISPECIES: hypothetical protein [Halobacillus]MBN8233853.1 hypothetical protein [Halobacillus kuroshimensis]